MHLPLRLLSVRLFPICRLVFICATTFIVMKPAASPASDDGLPIGPADAFKVLFIGNSHLFVNDVPARVQKHLQPFKGRIAVRTFARGGARLSSFTRRHDVTAALTTSHWDVVVLQEATASFLSPEGRRHFHEAVKWFSQRVPAKAQIILYQTWPWRADSRYFAGTSSNAAKLWEAQQLEHRRAARLERITIAPVGPCWMKSSRRAALYSNDGNHASIAGSSLAAAVIARTIVRNGHNGC